MRFPARRVKLCPAKTDGWPAAGDGELPCSGRSTSSDGAMTSAAPSRPGEPAVRARPVGLTGFLPAWDIARSGPRLPLRGGHRRPQRVCPLMLLSQDKSSLCAAVSVSRQRWNASIAAM